MSFCPLVFAATKVAAAQMQSPAFGGLGTGFQPAMRMPNCNLASIKQKPAERVSCSRPNARRARRGL